MKNTDHTVEEDIVELKLRFDTAPQMLVKLDYKHLVHTIEHLNGSVGECNKELWRKDVSKKLSKKSRQLFTSDGFIIADKSLSCSCRFYTGERLAIVSKAVLENIQNGNYMIHLRDGGKKAEDGTIETDRALRDFEIRSWTRYCPEPRELRVGDVIIVKPNDSGDYYIEIIGHNNKIFTFYGNYRYIDGVRQNQVQVIKDSWAGHEFPDFDSFLLYLKDIGFLDKKGRLLRARVALKRMCRWGNHWSYRHGKVKNQYNRRKCKFVIEHPGHEELSEGPKLELKLKKAFMCVWGLAKGDSFETRHRIAHFYIDRVDCRYKTTKRYYFDLRFNQVYDEDTYETVRIHTI